MTLIEFIEATPKRAVGERMRVDDASARSFCDIKKVAKRIDEAAEAAEAAAAAADPGEQPGEVVFVAADGTETPSEPDADGMHTLVSEGTDPEDDEDDEGEADASVSSAPGGFVV